MFGIQFIKSSPNTFIIQVRNGRTVRAGAGLCFWYFAPTSSLLAVPLSASETPFVWRMTTADHQDVQLHGTIAFRIADPERAAQRLDFSAAADGSVRAEEDGSGLAQQIDLLTQAKARAELQRLPFEAALLAADSVAAGVRKRLAESHTLSELGIEVIDVVVISIKATPDAARALEAPAREAVLKRADDALYERRNAAIEQERRIKESELATDLAVQARQREVREGELDIQRMEQQRNDAIAAEALEAQVAREARRREFVELSAHNLERESVAKLHATRSLLGDLGKLDPQVLQALALAGGNPQLAFAQAFQTLAQNAGRIGTLNLGPDLLGQLIDQHAATR